MLFAILTLLSALSLAAVAGWFSIAGFMAIYAGAPMYALIMGIVTECAKLDTTSWLYRNWQHAGWKLKAPLIYFTLALMTATSIGVYGFLSKAHLEQGAGTIDNSAKIEALQYQIDREKTIVADNEKVIGQLDATVNSLLGKDRADRSLAVRKSQEKQRAQLRTDIATSQKKIDELSAEKFKLESEVRKLELEVGPIRYIADLMYGTEGDRNKNIEAAVRIFTLLLVSTLDPLAVILLIAANHTLVRLRNEKEQASKKTGPAIPDSVDEEESISTTQQIRSEAPGGSIQETRFTEDKGSDLDATSGIQETSLPGEISFPPIQIDEEAPVEQKSDVRVDYLETAYPGEEEVESSNKQSADTVQVAKVDDEVQEERNRVLDETEEDLVDRFIRPLPALPTTFAKSPNITTIDKTDISSLQRFSAPVVHPVQEQPAVENVPHFVPRRINEEEIEKTIEAPRGNSKDEVSDQGGEAIHVSETEENYTPPEIEAVHQEASSQDSLEGDTQSGSKENLAPTNPRNKYSGLGWISVFKGAKK